MMTKEERALNVITGKPVDYLPSQITIADRSKDAHGQLLIFHDMFGLYPKFTPKMAKQYGDAGKVIGDGLKQYVQEVTGGVFPEPERYFHMKDEAYQELQELLDAKG